jgi:hypothetical protein
MANPGVPTRGPGNKPVPDVPPAEAPPGAPDEVPDVGPTGPRTPYPVNDPGFSEPAGPGSEPGYLPGTPTDPDTRMKSAGGD